MVKEDMFMKKTEWGKRTRNNEETIYVVLDSGKKKKNSLLQIPSHNLPFNGAGL